jgi:hypothetical protein
VKEEERGTREIEIGYTKFEIVKAVVSVISQIPVF